MMKHGAKVQLNQMSTDERRQLLESSIDKARVPPKALMATEAGNQ